MKYVQIVAATRVQYECFTGARVWGSSRVSQTSLVHCFFFSPLRAVRLHFSSDCNPCKQSKWPWWLYPLRARTSRGDVLSHDNFVTVVGSGGGEGRMSLSCGLLHSLSRRRRDCWPCRLQLLRLLLTSAAVTPVVPVSR